ncbi:MAG: hypothetical protein LBH44_06725 [Treponema sp.]|jgi:hypothetical protein|nr:hypothetical protein [Treponema sp.]
MRVTYCIPIAFLFLLLSCATGRELLSYATGRERISYIDKSKFPFDGCYNAGSVDVNIDFVDEASISAQVKMTAKLFLENRQKSNSNENNALFLDIVINERSFLHRVDMYNSIYIACTLRTENGEVAAREVGYVSQKKSILVATEQKKIITRMLNNLIGGIEKFEEAHYKAIQKAEKENAKTGS